MSDNIKSILNHKASVRPHDECEIAYDVVFVLNANSKGWILDKICKIVERYSDLNCFFLYTERNECLTTPLPKARAYFFAHFAIAFWTMIKYPYVHGGSIFTYFTHFDQNKGVTSAELTEFMNLCDHVFVMNSADHRALVSLGAESEKLTAVIGGADPDIFQGHKRGKGVVGFVGAYYPRKQPEKMIALIRSMPDVEFLLLAPGPDDVANEGMLWRNWPEYQALISLPNLRYVEAPYEDYPTYFAQMDVYVSLSSQEGGPIPVIEAMMSNAVALATNTGFAEDVLTGDLAQYVLDVDARVETIAAKVRSALADKKTDVREIAKHISWEAVGNQILDIITPTLKLDSFIPVITDRAHIGFEIAGNGRAFLDVGWSYIDGCAHLAQSPASIMFSLENQEPGYFSMITSFGLPSLGAEDADPTGMWQLEIALNGRNITSRALEASADPVLVENWFTLSEEDTQAPLTMTVDVKPRGRLARGAQAPQAVLHIMLWNRIDAPLIGTEHSFTNQSEANIVGCDGWHRAEQSGSWSKKPSATVSLFIPASETSRTLTPVVTGRILASHLDNTVTVRTVTTSTQQQKTVVFPSDDFMSFELGPVHVPAESMGPILITFARSQTFKPAELSDEAQDMRDLNLHLHHISLRE